MIRGKLVLLIVPLALAAFAGYLLKWEPLLIPWAGWFFAFTVTGFTILPETRVPGFVLLSIWAYAFLGNIIPQQEFRQSSFTDIERTPEAFVAAGEKIFFGKGKCSSCHSIGPGKKSRCPDILKASREAATRKPGFSAKEYLIESVYKPTAYVVSGYTPIMPEPWKPPIAITPLEIEMVVAYIQSLSGGAVDVSPVKPPVDIEKGGGTASDSSVFRFSGNVRNGKRIFESGKGKCLSCHRVLDRGGEEKESVGPDLTDIGALNTVTYIRESVLYPNARILKGYGVADFRLKGGERVEGALVREDAKSLTVKVGEKESVFLKKDIGERTVQISETGDLSGRGYFRIRAELSGGKRVEGAIISETPGEITVGSTGKSEVIKKRDIKSVKGQRILRTSRMPRYDHVLTIKEFTDLMAYLVSLKGKPEEGSR